MDINYTYHPNLNKSKPRIMTGLIALIGLVLLFSASFLPYPAIWQGVAICMLAIAVYFAAHYLLTDFTYSIETSQQRFDEEEPVETHDFIILRNGRMAARIGMTAIVKIEWETPENKKVKSGTRIFNYFSEWGPTRICRVTYLDTSLENGEPVLIRFLSDDTLFGYIESLIGTQE